MAENVNWEEKYRKCSEEYQKAVAFLKKNLLIQKKNFTGMAVLLSDILSMVHPELGSHSKSTAQYTKSLSYLLHLEKEKRELLFYSSLLHDIGLLNAPKEVYSYNPLSGDAPIEEYLEHPVEGVSLISQIPHLTHVAKIVRHHHEQWDGKGFPDGLSGDSIPIEARILAVANAFDWLTRFDHLQPREALETIQEKAGTFFDPEVTDVFYKFMDLRLKEKESGIENVSIDKLRRGHILNDDLILENGMLLFPAGTYLNESAIEKIQKFSNSLTGASHIRVHL